MEKDRIAHLETQIRELGAQLTHVADAAPFEELIKIIHNPGWTTPAEALLVRGVVDAMLAHARASAELKQALLNGSRAVGVPARG